MEGLGDWYFEICSSGGNRPSVPQWLSEGQTEASVYQQAENGKTELSLMHFTITNPRWHPPQDSSVFISHLKEKVQHDAATGPPAQHLFSDTPLCSSLLSNESANIVSVTARPPSANEPS